MTLQTRFLVTAVVAMITHPKNVALLRRGRSWDKKKGCGFNVYKVKSFHALPTKECQYCDDKGVKDRRNGFNINRDGQQKITKISTG
mmetsp:Transcript_3444/g.5200  ORF Transcript_3444/g.5200 Transcript_3444/m.5200 type:complete len:87 (+) Transcript_3444:270-530(+)